jgi:hypothetical protein
MHENDGRPPDTADALLDLTHNFSPTSHTRLLQSYSWQSPNSCFFDNGLELWFRAFALWPGPTQAHFLGLLPHNSVLATIFYHFTRRLKWISDANGTDREGHQILGLAQSLVAHAIFVKWVLYPSHKDYGCAITWLHHAIHVCPFGCLAQSDPLINPLLPGLWDKHYHSVIFWDTAHTHLPLHWWSCLAFCCIRTNIPIVFDFR